MTSEKEIIDSYLKVIDLAPNLTDQQERIMAEYIESGLFSEEMLADGSYKGKYNKAELEELVVIGKEAKLQLLEANYFRVYKYALKNEGKGLTLLQLIQEGNLGLLKAIEKFDYTLEEPFKEYASYWIRTSISKAIKKTDKTLRLPVHIVDAVNKVANLREELEERLGRSPTISELAVELDMTIEKVSEILKFGRERISYLSIG